MAEEQDTMTAVDATQAAAADASAASAVQVLPEDSQEKAARRSRRLLTIILIALIVLLLLACGALYALLNPNAGARSGKVPGIEWIRSVYGFGVNPDQLMHPTSVAVAPNGQTFWVTDAANFRLIQYGMNGSFKRLVTQTAEGQKFQYPSRMSVAPNGSFYVAQQTYDSVLILDQSFHLKHVLQIQTPFSVATNRDMLVVGSKGGFAAFKLDGSLIGQVGQAGHGKNDFDVVGGLALDNQDNVYVTDTYNNRLSKYDHSGNLAWIKETGFPGNQGISGGANLTQKELEKKYPANMQVPMGVTLDANNRVIVIDMFDYSVSAFSTKNGNFLGKWGEYGTNDGFFSNPSGIAYNRQQDVFLENEAALGRVQIFRMSGSSAFGLSGLLGRFIDFLNACWIPLLIILLLIALYVISRILLRRRRNAGKDVVELES